MIGAVTDDLNGIDAFRKIMEWGSPHIKIKEGCQQVERQINVPLMHLLMESSQLIDEESESDSSKTAPHLEPAIPSEENETIHSNPEFYQEDINFKKLKAILSRSHTKTWAKNQMSLPAKENAGSQYSTCRIIGQEPVK